MTMNQPTLQMPITADVALVPIAMACASRGIHIDAGFANVESGVWPFAFDISAGAGAIRELRVWVMCLTDVERTEALKAQPGGLREVVTHCIGTTSGDVRGAALEIRWQVSNQTLRRLLSAAELRGRLSGRTLWINRGSLEGFLERRRVV